VGIERLKFAAILFAASLLAGGCRAGAIPRARAGAQRIVSLAPSVTETLFAIGAGAQVVGVSQYCDYPPAARKLPRVGTFLTPNIEAIAALRPTVVIGPLTSADLREMRALRAMGITTVAVGSDDSIAQIEHSIWQIGNQTGRAGAARRLLAEIRLRMRSTQEHLNGRPVRSVLMVVGHQPMVAVGRGTYLDELLALARGANIADASAQAWPRLSLEYIIASRPDVILDGQMGTDPSTPDSFWLKYSSIPAVKNHRVYGYPEDPTLHPGPRIGSTLEILARLIHPEAFPTGELPPKSIAPIGEASQ
jgi:iron complex transport system substrate-binding protein